MMKKWIGILLFLTVVFSVEGSLAFDFNVSTGFNYDGWDDTKDNKARQSYIPLWMEARYKDFSLSFLTGYVHTHFHPAVGSNRSFGHALDSKLNLSYEMIGKLPVDALIGLDFNLPTGKTDLRAKDQILLMDPDLISITQFGEGFNVNPTLSLAKEWGGWVFGIGAGYLWRGRYDYGNLRETSTSIIKIEDYDPGNIFILNSEIRYDFSSHWYGRVFGQYAWYEESEWKESVRSPYYNVNRNHSFQEGEFWLLGMGFHYNSKKWDADLTLRGLFREKNKRDYQERWYHFDSSWGALLKVYSPLTQELKNSHGDEWIADFTVKYFWDHKTSIKSFLQALFFSKNEYPSFSPHYLGRREKYTLGFRATRSFPPFLEGEVYVKGFVMHDGERKYPYLFGGQTISERHYKGISTGLMLTGRF